MGRPINVNSDIHFIHIAYCASSLFQLRIGSKCKRAVMIILSFAHPTNDIIQYLYKIFIWTETCVLQFIRTLFYIVVPFCTTFHCLICIGEGFFYGQPKLMEKDVHIYFVKKQQ